jgi:hypothetical protein
MRGATMRVATMRGATMGVATDGATMRRRRPFCTASLRDRPDAVDSSRRIKLLEIFSPYTGSIRSRIGWLPPLECDRSLLAPDLASRFVAIDTEPAISRFVTEHPPLGFFDHVKGQIAQVFYSSYWLGMQETFLHDEDSMRLLLQGIPTKGEADGSFGSLLDVGAGTGSDSLRIRRMFSSTMATEAAAPCVKMMQGLGLDCVHAEDLNRAQGIGSEYNVVMSNNVLDRCDRPIDFLKAMMGRMHKDGRMVVTIRLPVDAFTIGSDGAAITQPKGAGIIDGIAEGRSFVQLQGATFESQLTDIAARFEEQCGLKVSML